MKTLNSLIMYLYFKLTYFRAVVWSLIVFFTFTVVSVIIFSGEDISTKPVGWEKSYFISSAGLKTRNINVASRGNYIIVVYEGYLKNSKGVYASISFNSGKSFFAPVKIAQVDDSIGVNPHVAISPSGEMSVFWHNLVIEETSNRIFFSKSNDSGANWTSPEQVKIGYAMEMLPMNYYDNKGRLHLFFHGFKNNLFYLYHSIAGDGGNFKVKNSLVTVNKKMRGAFFPSIIFSGSKIFISWQGKGENFSDSIYFMRSGNYGSSWTRAEKIISKSANETSPSMILVNSDIYLAFRNNSEKNWAIYLSKGIDLGKSWSIPVKISDTNSNCYSPDLVNVKDKINIVWYDSRENIPKIFTRKYDISKSQLDNESKLSTGKLRDVNPLVISSAGKSIVFWESGSRIKLKYSDIYVKPPKLFSRTHRKNSWSRKTTAVIQWKTHYDSSEITGYATAITSPSDINKNERLKFMDPSIVNVRAGINKKVLPELEDGVTYFHIRARDGAGNLSRTVHYRVNVSANPLPVPIVVSPSHAQGKSSKNKTAKFSWAVDDVLRLKGFQYSLSKNRPVVPSKFITDFNINLDLAKEGQYYFTLRAIDQTNLKSEIATYIFFLGKAEKVDIESIKKLAHGDIHGIKIRRRRIKPYLKINFPFNVNKPFDKNSFSAIIKVKNIKYLKVAGYSVQIGNSKSLIPERINQKSTILNLNNLKNGTYFLSVKAKYSKKVSGKKKYLWTKPLDVKFTINVPVVYSPVEKYALLQIEKMKKNIGAISVILFSLLLLVVYIGYGARLIFYTKVIGFKFKVLFKL